METFVAILRAMVDSGLEPLQAGIQTTPTGSHIHEMTFVFAAEDEVRIVDVLDQLEQLGCEPGHAPGSLMVTAGTGNRADGS
jgi:hypothetical protein